MMNATRDSQPRRIAAMIAILVMIFSAIGIAAPAAAAGDENLFGNQTPQAASDADKASVEVGVKFVPSVSGSITGVRFYKGPGNTGIHQATLWNRSGAPLATATFANETTSGWQTVNFSGPITVSAGSTYIASYRAPNGGYAATSNFFASPYTRGNLTVPGDGGVFTYDETGMPVSTWNATNYFVDVIFQPSGSTPTTSPSPTPSATPTATPTTLSTGTRPGNPRGTATVPSGAGLEDVSKPDRVVGNGTATSCTSDAVVAAVAAGGVITFNCGANPMTITLKQTLKVKNSTAKLVLDGGGKITLSGGGKNRILYTDTCDTSLGSVSGNCLYAPTTPKVTVQNITMADGNATNAGYVSPGDTKGTSGGGGAIFQLGGRLKVVSSTFVRNVCASNGPDLGGGAIRVLAQNSPTPNDLDASYAARNQYPVMIVQSTFGGKSGQGNSCSNGGAASGLRTPMTILNSLVSYNNAVGCCSNPAKAGTPGGGSGGAFYSDGTSYNVSIGGSDLQYNTAKAGGSAIFYVSNDKTGRLSIDKTVSKNNTYAASGQSTPQSFQNYPGIFFLSSGAPSITNSTVQ